MIIEINDDLYERILTIVKSKNITVYEELKSIPPYKNKSIKHARDTRSENIKVNINQAIKDLINKNINPTKYQVKKLTNISYVTLNKYYDMILIESKQL